MKKPAVAAAMGLFAVSLAALAWLAKTRGDAVRPVDLADLGASALDGAAQAAPGQRVLVIVTKSGAAPAGRILQSARGPEGWMPYPATPDPGNSLAPTLEALAAAAAADYAPDQRFDLDTIRALQIFGVAVVVVSDGKTLVPPQTGERDATMSVANGFPALRVSHTNPVWLLLNDGSPRAATDPIGFVRSLRFGDATFQDDEYRQWGGGVTIDAAAASEFLFAWPAAGARVTLDGGPAVTRSSTVPMLVVKVPAGRHRVEVDYGEPQNARNVIAIAAAAGAVIAFVALWLGLRPTPSSGADA